MNFRKIGLFAVFAFVVVSLGPITHHSAVSSSQAKLLRADGGLPMPPPMGPGSLVSQGSTLMADGGLPMPPPPLPGGTLAVVS